MGILAPYTFLSSAATAQSCVTIPIEN